MGTHPIMFTDEDPGLAELRELALTLPEAQEQISWGRPVFKAGKIFAMFGGNAKTTGNQRAGRGSAPAKGQMTAYPFSVIVKVDPSERAALEQDERFYFPAYWGPSGWLGLDLTAAQVDWQEVAELLDASYRAVAPKRLIRLLDEHEAR